jgi:hypothetical protein
MRRGFGTIILSLLTTSGYYSPTSNAFAAASNRTGESTVHASAIQVVGGASLINAATTRLTPTKGAAASDLFAGVPDSSAGSCTSRPDTTNN